MKKFLLFALLPLGLLTLLSHSEKGLQVGDEAPMFSLKNTDGNMVSLSGYQDKNGVILVFTCNHCPYAQMYENRILELDKKYSEKGWPVVAINPNDPAAQPEDSYELMVQRANEKGYTFPYLFDEGQKVFPLYGATRTPHVFLLQRVGNAFKVAYIGAIDDNAKSAEQVRNRFVEDAIADMEAGRKVKTPSTAAIGCSIKVK
jgi:peroxiredoxin